jgi:hypothetical protein
VTWHAVKLHNWCRPLGAAEACCEQVGSIISHAWDKRESHELPAELMDAVCLRHAKVTCVGGTRDEALVEEVTDALLAMDRRPMVSTKRRRVRRQEAGIESSRTIGNLLADDAAYLVASGGWHGDVEPTMDDLSVPDGLTLCADEDDAMPRRVGGQGSSAQREAFISHRRARRATSQPAMAMSSKVSKQLQRAVDGPDGRVAAVNVSASMDRAVGRGVAGSTRRGLLQSWLASDEGKAFRKARDECAAAE